MRPIRAAVCRDFGAPLSVEDLRLRPPGPGEVEVTLEAVAICHSDIHFAEGAWGGDLPTVYGAASLAVMPSVYEGFGMPVVEAMACGTPVVAARSSSLPEAGGEAALYFDIDDVDKLTENLEAVLFDRHLAASLQVKGFEQASSFSWRKSGEETAAVYRRAMAEE